MSGKREVDMLNGPLAGKIILFAVPLAASSILQQLFNSADVAVVGHFAGSQALAAVGTNTPIISLFVNAFTGISIGANVVIGNLIGNNRRDSINKVVHTVITFSLLIGIALLVLGLFVSEDMLLMIDTPSTVIEQANLYLKIYFLAMPFISLYNFGAAILRSYGDSQSPMYCLIISGIANVLLNLLFVIVFHMGVAGVALATLIANVIGAAIVLIILIRNTNEFHLSFRRLTLDSYYLKKVLQNGVPSAVQSMVFCVSNVLIQSGINSFGEKAVAGCSTGLSFEYFSFPIISAFGMACVSFVSQNYGAGNYARCRKILRITVLQGMLITEAICILFILFAPQLVGIYTADPVVAQFAIARMKRVVIIEALTASYELPAACLRGMGHPLAPTVLTILGSVVFRVIWIFTVFARFHTYEVLMIVYPVSWVITGIMVITAYFKIRKKYI